MTPSRLGLWFRNLRRNLVGRRADRDLDDELQAWLELRADEKTRDGFSPGDARRQALIEMEGASQVSEAVREVRTGAWLESIGRDVRFGARIMARRPLATGAAVLALALGIGATTAVFSVVNAVLLRPLPYANPERLVVVLHEGVRPVAPANFLDWRAAMGSFTDMAAAEFWRADYVADDDAEKLFALRVTPNLFPLLGVAPVVGRHLAEADPAASAIQPEVVLSHRLWTRRFSRDPGVIGRMIALDGQTFTIVGVMPAEFQFAPFWATQTELWAPLGLGPRAASRGGQSLRVFARLRPGVDLETAQAEVAAVTGRLEAQFEGTNRDVQAVDLTERVVGDVRGALALLLGAVAFVLLMTCANVAHMLLAHGATRFREFGMRLALGASRNRLMRQVLTESLMLVTAGGLAGIGLAVWGVEALTALAPPDLPRLDTVAIDTRVLLFAASATLLTGVLFGLAPAVRAARSGVAATVRQAAGRPPGRRGRGALVGVEFGLALMLLAGAGLTIESFRRVQMIEPGFDPSGVLSMTVSVTGTAVGSPARRAAFFQEAVAAVESLPGVRAASAINHLPLAGDIWGAGVRVEGRPEPRRGEGPSATYRVTLPGYFATMGIPVVAGRDLLPSDDLAAERVVVISEFFANRLWPDGDALGRRFSLRGDPPEWMRVVGIVADTVREAWTEEVREEMYLPYLQSSEYLTSAASHYSYLTLVARTDGDPASLAPAVRAAVWRIQSGLPISDVQTMAAVVRRATARPRFYMVLLTVFAAAAMTLAAVGIYGVMTVGVAERRREIGIRMALGAGPGRVLRLIVGQGLSVALAGTAAGIGGAVLLSGSMGSLVYGVEPTDPATLASVALVLSAVAVVACYLPARRATRADALVALRDD